MSNIPTRALLFASAACLLLAVPTLAQEFPVTIEHKFGTTVIEAKPERVASVDHGGIGNLLAIGVSPYLVREWRDNFPFTTPPYGRSLLTTEPVVFDGDIDPELVASTHPDVIIALASGIDEDMYAKLSLIAPVVAIPDGIGDYELSWDQRALIAARALGEEAEAQRQIDAIHARFAEIRDSHPEWQGKTAVVGRVVEGEFSAYNHQDIRAKFMAELGFVTPRALDAITGDSFYNRLSAEIIEPITADVLVWYGGSQELQMSLDYPARPFLPTTENGGEIFLTDEHIAAFARQELLSIPVTVDYLVPLLEAAADADAATAVDGDLQQ
ncbi:ABC transporter substrate-binding protein [Devosia sediminis]|uniref:ABC transporter substrate-binding protein n=1 Tax=Devosia sediminis TaxID=2798801 RepID=A0A934MR42_9HYPH|nr:ABC transporter substrate-binding protein [Devosia sediminis]MBJ3785029.1 ABC transporter substrate-binding protein [Devosia sediminis]